MRIHSVKFFVFAFLWAMDRNYYQKQLFLNAKNENNLFANSVDLDAVAYSEFSVLNSLDEKFCDFVVRFFGALSATGLPLIFHLKIP